MKKMTSTRELEYENLITLIVGFWVMVAPLFLGIIPDYPGAFTYMWNFFLMGLAVVIMSILAVTKKVAWAETVNLIAGLWLILSPLFLIYYNLNDPYFWNSIVCGILISVFSALSLPILDKIIYHKHERGNEPFWISAHHKFKM